MEDINIKEVVEGLFPNALRFNMINGSLIIWGYKELIVDVICKFPKATIVEVPLQEPDTGTVYMITITSDDIHARMAQIIAKAAI